jgi:hypothetical protein
MKKVHEQFATSYRGSVFVLCTNIYYLGVPSLYFVLKVYYLIPFL